jgi:hypothetical protein
MASRKRVPIGTVRPVVTVGGIDVPGPGRSAPARTINAPGPGRVWIGSETPVIDVVGRLTGPVKCTPPRPRYLTDDRHGRTSVTRYAGMQPLEQEITLKFDGQRDRVSVIGKIRDLETLAMPVGSGSPPLVRAFGASVRHQGLWWRVTRIVENTERAIYINDDQVVYVATVTLTQHVKDQLLNFAGANAQGFRNRTTHVREGEDSLYDVAKRVYKDRGKAKDIARANPGLRLGQKLKRGTKLRLP